MSVRRNPQGDKPAHDLETVTAALLSDLSRYFSEAVTLSAPHIDALTLSAWTLHSATHSASRRCTYLLINSDTHGCGKSELTYWLSQILPDSHLLAMPSISALQRISSEILIIDQADTLLSARSTDINLFAGWLNAGHSRGYDNPLSDPENITGVVNRSPFGSRVLAGINIVNMLDDPVISRCVIVHMREQTRSDVERERMNPDELDTLAASLRTRIEAWAAKAMPLITDDVNRARFVDLSDGTRLFNRDCDIWAPLIKVCELAGNTWLDNISLAIKASADLDVSMQRTQAEIIDDELRALMRTQRVTIANYANYGDSRDAPLQGSWNFPVTNADLGWPFPRYSNNRLPGGSLVINTSRKSAELRFAASTFDQICLAMSGKRKKRQVTNAYREVGRLHAPKNTASEKLELHSGQGKISVTAIDVSHWFWPEQPQGMTRMEKDIERILSAETDDEVWEADR